MFVFHVCSRALSFCSSQWQHKQQSGALVVLWSSGSGGNDTRTDLLPEEIFWSTASSVVWLKKKVPLCPPLFSPTPRHVFIRWKWDSILSKPPHLIGSRIFLFSCYRWVPFKKEIKAHAFWNRCQLCSIFFKNCILSNLLQANSICDAFDLNVITGGGDVIIKNVLRGEACGVTRM